jgi:hypothetical protein
MSRRVRDESTPVAAALRSLWRHGRNVLIDLRFGARIGGRGKPKPPYYAQLGAYSFTNSDYASLGQMFNGLIASDDVLVDIGSGRGRVLNFWLLAGHRGPIYGLELDEEYAAASARRLANHPNVRIIQGDAIENIPRDATCFYLFNPFDARAMTRFRDALTSRIARLERVRIVYYAPTCLDVWDRNPRWSVELCQLSPDGLRRCAERHRLFALIAHRTAGRDTTARAAHATG